MEPRPPHQSINYKRHFLVWVLITTYLCLLDPMPGSLAVQIPSSALIIMNYMFVFYSLSLVVVPFVYNKKWFRALVALVITVCGFFLIDLLNFNYLLPLIGQGIEPSPVKEVFLGGIRPFILVSTPAVAYFFNDLSLQKVEIQNSREKSLLLKELNFLKNQFNSHITFNFLNYCYSKVHQISGDTAEAIDLFSNMLRYSLTIKPETKVAIEKEINYIQDFIRLQRLLSSDVYVNFKYEGEFEKNEILPSILITFIENAFTHGEFTRPSNPITIQLDANHATLKLRVSNKKRTRRNINSTGVGLENVKQLLRLYYPEQHKLEISNSADEYTTQLHLSLN